MNHGTLTDVLSKIQLSGRGISERACANIVLQLLTAINYLHSRKIWHCDFKLENVMMRLERNADSSTDIICKLTDFGFAQVMDPNQRSNKFIGSALYLAPEMVSQQPYDSKVDIWALGVITFIMLTSELPFSGGKQGSRRLLNDEILTKTVDLSLFDKFHDKGRPVRNFILKCLTKNPCSRASADELLNDPWITANSVQQRVKGEKRLDVGLNF